MAYTRVNWQNGEIGGTPLSADNLNIMDKGIYDLSLNNNYSTSEQIIGKWIDGKPIYRKVMNLTTPSTSAETSITTITNADTVISINASVKNSVGAQLWFNYLFNSSNFGTLYFDNTTKNIVLSVSNAAYQNRPIIVIVEYTKTTD